MTIIIETMQLVNNYLLANKHFYFVLHGHIQCIYENAVYACIMYANL